MESTPTNRTSPVVTPPSEEQEPSNGRATDSHNHSSNSNHSKKGQDPRVDQHLQSHSLFEIRGNLDTLAAAALKPLAGKTYGERNAPQPYQQQLQNHKHHHQGQNHSHSTRSNHSPDDSRAINSRALEQNYTSSPHDDHSTRFHYRERGQPSDEDSEDDPSLHSRHSPYRSHGSHLQKPSKQEQMPPCCNSISPRRSPEQDKSTRSFHDPQPNNSSSMSISSLLDDSSSREAFPRKQMNNIDSNPANHAGRSGDSLKNRRIDEGETGGETRTQRRSSSPGRMSDTEERSQMTHHHDNHHHHSRKDLGTELSNTVSTDQYHHHIHQTHSRDVTQHHHHHIPHQHHQHIHRHRHPQHIIHQHQHQRQHLHTHPHAHAHAQPVSLHHQHHHAHHHHLHHSRTSSGASAFSYMPQSLGLKLSPKLKVNATQVYISYLIQLDQMQRAQHLMRSEKRKSIHNDAIISQEESSRNSFHKQHFHAHARTPSSGEPSRNVQIAPHQEEATERDGGTRSPLSETSDERKKRNTRKSEDAEMNSSGTFRRSESAETADRASPTISNHARSLQTHPQHSHIHTHPHPHPHQHIHGHSHLHGHHSAPVLPAHIHPPQHHHHIVPSSTNLERGSTKINGSQSVHRHQTLYHHHPHHHPYHPNHPNHQHHFHHHGHPGHNHNHIHHNHNQNNHLHSHAHVHGHGHTHLHHAHAHNHVNHNHSHSHKRSPSVQKNSILEQTHRERGYSELSSQPPPSQTPNSPSAAVSPLVKSTNVKSMNNSESELVKVGSNEQDSIDPKHKEDIIDTQLSREGADNVVEAVEGTREESKNSNQHEAAYKPLPVSSAPLLLGPENAMLVD
ncbi:hypothetical protein BGZ46_001027 [Entomortierella lignicola]|nr:hypothetical protein BGZ46_001027 [Entomortierella lignicola]